MRCREKSFSEITSAFQRLSAADQLRGRAMFLISKAGLLRGQSSRGLELSHLMLIDVPDLGPTQCKSLELVLKKGKTNQVARKDTAAFIRAKDAAICPVGALGLYFYQRFTVNQESFPDLSARQNWFQIKVFVAENSEVIIEYVLCILSRDFIIYAD